MTIIIDANRAGDFAAAGCNHAPEIARRVSANNMRIVVGGELLRELVRTCVGGLISEWARAGRLVRCEDDIVDAESVRYSGLQIRSNDPHVLALASVSRCRLLYSSDDDLIKDFKNKKFIDAPRGKVVTARTRAKLARELFDSLGA